MTQVLDDLHTINAIAKRAIALCPEANFDFRSTCMDLEAAHCELGLRLQDLKNADPFDLLHDVGGIRRHLDRRTAKLTDCFLPRFVMAERPDHLPSQPSWLTAPNPPDYSPHTSP